MCAVCRRCVSLTLQRLCAGRHRSTRCRPQALYPRLRSQKPGDEQNSAAQNETVRLFSLVVYCRTRNVTVVCLFVCRAVRHLPRAAGAGAAAAGSSEPARLPPAVPPRSMLHARCRCGRGSRSALWCSRRSSRHTCADASCSARTLAALAKGTPAADARFAACFDINIVLNGFVSVCLFVLACR